MYRTIAITVSQEDNDPDLELAVMKLEREIEDLVEDFKATTEADVEMEIEGDIE